MSQSRLGDILEPVLENLYIPKAETQSFLNRIEEICKQATPQIVQKRGVVDVTQKWGTRVYASRDILTTYGRRIVKIPGDGNCQFRALAHQIHLDENVHMAVRDTIIDHMIKNRKLYEGFVSEENFDVYIEKMQNYGEWGDHLTLQAAADVFGLYITVLTTNRSIHDSAVVTSIPPNPSNLRGEPRGIVLAFHEENHYDSTEAI